MNSQCDALLRSLTRPTAWRPAWPIWAIVPLLTTLNQPLTYSHLVTFVAGHPVDNSVREVRRKLAAGGLLYGRKVTGAEMFAYYQDHEVPE